MYGLRRAFVLAGARAQVMSLWQVDGVATKDLMIALYQRLRSGDPLSEALGETQRQMLGDQRLAHPYYWASFIQLGDWRPLL